MIQFDRRISIDGVAVIVAAVGLIVWLTSIKNTVEGHTAALAEHASQIQKLSDNENLMQQNLAVLTALQRKRETQ